MREIKFRIKDEFNDWLYFDLDMGETVACYFPDYQRTTLGQYTGLKDKNGKEIYEGDIIEHESGMGYRVLIEWQTQEWNEDGFGTGYQLIFSSDQYSIIGNKYENPELIKTGAKEPVNSVQQAKCATKAEG